MTNGLAACVYSFHPSHCGGHVMETPEAGGLGLQEAVLPGGSGANALGAHHPPGSGFGATLEW